VIDLCKNECVVNTKHTLNSIGNGGYGSGKIKFTLCNKIISTTKYPAISVFKRNAALSYGHNEFADQNKSTKSSGKIMLA